jgi:rhodanese-related sulfurtransferase
MGDTVGQGYSGDVEPREAWRILSQDPEAVLVDVRTDAEWSYVGLPDLSALGKRPVLVAWQNFPSMERNGGFAAELAAKGASKTAPILFLCRSGARSRAAAQAMTGEGYARCYNVAGGFEGDLDAERHRGRINGWKAQGLPWAQG